MFLIQERRVGAVALTTDPAKISVDAVHGLVGTCYWATGIPRERMARAMENSLNFAAFDDEALVGFARIVTDGATFAYLCDVVVATQRRGEGIARLLLEEIVRHPDLAGLRRWMLVTRDAQGLYAKFGFAPLAAPERYMEIHRPS